MDKSLSPRDAFLEMTEDELDAWMSTARFGDFVFTDAVRPSPNADFVPREGHDRFVWMDKETGRQCPVVMAAISRDKLFDAFLSLLEPLGDEVSVVLEASHGLGDGHVDLRRDEIDTPVLLSAIMEFEDVILDDGLAGIAVLAHGLEIKLDSHKVLYVYGQDLRRFESRLEVAEVPRREGMQFVTWYEHIHQSSPELTERFNGLRELVSAG